MLPTWSGGKDKDREGDDGLLRPVTRETTRSRWGSESTTGLSDGRNGSLLDTPEQHEQLGPIRRHEILSMDDLEKVKKRRKLGEEYVSCDLFARRRLTNSPFKVSTVCIDFDWDVSDRRHPSAGLHLLQST